jgi:hypothetical protein
MTQKNNVTFLISYSKKNLIEFVPAYNFYTKKAVVISILFTLVCMLSLFYKQYLLGIILFAYSFYGVLCHYFQVNKYYNMTRKKWVGNTCYIG